PPPGRSGSAGQQPWWDQLDLSAVERLRVQQDRTILETVERLIAEVDAELTRLECTATLERAGSLLPTFRTLCRVVFRSIVADCSQIILIDVSQRPRPTSRSRGRALRSRFAATPRQGAARAWRRALGQARRRRRRDRRPRSFPGATRRSAPQAGRA